MEELEHMMGNAENFNIIFSIGAPDEVKIMMMNMMKIMRKMN